MNATNHELLIVLEEMVELRAIAFEVLKVEYTREDLLNLSNATADRDLTSKASLQALGPRDVIGMNVSFKNPIDLKAASINVIDDLQGKG